MKFYLNSPCLFLMIELSLLFLMVSHKFEKLNKNIEENNLFSSAAMKFKHQTDMLLFNMYSNSNYKSICEDKKSSLNNERQFLMEDINNTDYFKYYDYDEIESELMTLSKNNPRYLKVTTGQKEFNLPYPGGECGTKK